PFPEEGRDRVPLSRGFAVVVHIALPNGHAGIGYDGRFRYGLRADFHEAADALPLRHGRVAAARAGHHDPALLVGVVGLVLLAFEGEPEDQRAAGAGAIGTQLGGAGGDGMHPLPRHEPEAAIGTGDADLASLAVEPRGRPERKSPGAPE